MPGQALLPYVLIFPLAGLAGFGLGLRYRLPIAVIASALFAALASYLARVDGSSFAATLLVAFATLVCLQAGYFIGALTVER